MDQRLSPSPEMLRLSREVRADWSRRFKVLSSNVFKRVAAAIGERQWKPGSAVARVSELDAAGEVALTYMWLHAKKVSDHLYGTHLLIKSLLPSESAATSRLAIESAAQFLWTIGDPDPRAIAAKSLAQLAREARSGASSSEIEAFRPDVVEYISKMAEGANLKVAYGTTREGNSHVERVEGIHRPSMGRMIDMTLGDIKGPQAYGQLSALAHGEAWRVTLAGYRFGPDGKSIVQVPDKYAAEGIQIVRRAALRVIDQGVAVLGGHVASQPWRRELEFL